MKPQDIQRTLLLKGTDVGSGLGSGAGVRMRLTLQHLWSYRLCGGCIERASSSLVLYKVEACQVRTRVVRVTYFELGATDQLLRIVLQCLEVLF